MLASMSVREAALDAQLLLLGPSDPSSEFVIRFGIVCWGVGAAGCLQRRAEMICYHHIHSLAS